MKCITLEDVEHIGQIFSVGASSEPEKISQKKVEKKAKSVPELTEAGMRVKTDRDAVLNHVESEFNARIMQLRDKILALLDESEMMVQGKMIDLQKGSKMLLDAVQDQFGVSASAVINSYSGAGIAYQSWDFENHKWGGMHSSRSVAEQLGNGVVKEVWVWYDKGTIKKVLNGEELDKYCP